MPLIGNTYRDTLLVSTTGPAYVFLALIKYQAMAKMIVATNNTLAQLKDAASVGVNIGQKDQNCNSNHQLRNLSGRIE